MADEELEGPQGQLAESALPTGSHQRTPPAGGAAPVSRSAQAKAVPVTSESLQRNGGAVPREDDDDAEVEDEVGGAADGDVADADGAVAELVDAQEAAAAVVKKRESKDVKPAALSAAAAAAAALEEAAEEEEESTQARVEAGHGTVPSEQANAGSEHEGLLSEEQLLPEGGAEGGAEGAGGGGGKGAGKLGGWIESDAYGRFIGISTFFNPGRHVNKVDNFRKFRNSVAEQGLQLLCVELVFGAGPCFERRCKCCPLGRVEG